MAEDINYIGLADALRASVRQYEQAHTLADQLEKIAGLSQQEGELKAKIEVLKADEAAAIKAKADAIDEYNTYVDSANNDLRGLQSQADSVIRNAREEANLIKNRAEEAAKSIEVAAKEQAEQIVMHSKSELEVINAQIKEGKVVLKQTENELAKVKADIEEQNRVLQAAKDKINSLLGGV